MNTSERLLAQVLCRENWPCLANVHPCQHNRLQGEEREIEYIRNHHPKGLSSMKTARMEDWSAVDE